MEKHYEAFKDILDEQIRKVAKKGDITPQELENIYKASSIVLDMETREAMKKAEEHGGSSFENRGAEAPNGGYSQRGSYGSYNHGNYNQSNRGNYNDGQSNHYPWFMYHDGGSNDSMSNRGNSYTQAVWNQDKPEMSTARGRGGYNRTSNNYAEAYDGAYEGAYDGAYASYENSNNDSSYRRGRSSVTGRYVSRDAGYSRAMDKERMIGKLEDMMDDAPSEKERRALQQCVEKLERQ